MARSVKYTKSELLEKLASLERNWGDTRYHTISDVCDMPSGSTYSNRFGSVTEARNAATVDKRPYKRGCSEERAKALMRELERSGKKVIYPNIDRELEKLVERSGKRFAEIREEAGLIRNHNRNDRTKFEMCEELSKIDKKYVSTEDVEEKCKFSVNQYVYTFGSLTEALECAGKKTTQHVSEFWRQTTGFGLIEQVKDELDGYDPDASFYVYRIQFSDTFYIGATSNLFRRIKEAEYWPEPKENAVAITVESYDSEDKASERERELRYKTAIQFDTNEVYGGRSKFHQLSPK